MTFYVMAPTFDHAWQAGVQPLMKNEITEEEAYDADHHSVPRLHAAPMCATRTCRLFDDLASEKLAARSATMPSDIDMRVLIPAFMISELRRAFEIGFLIVLPFLVIDMIVATLTMSMGMMMMPPTVISLPFKMLFFVLIDGWNLLVGGSSSAPSCLISELRDDCDSR